MYVRNIETTGNSNWQGDAYMLDLVHLYNPGVICDFGVGKWGKWGWLIRRSYDEWKAIHYKESQALIFGYEGSEKNFEALKMRTQSYGYDDIICADFLRFHLNYPGDWPTPEVCIFGDSLEHVDYTDAVELINQLKMFVKKAILVQLPLGEYEQEVDINPFENHRSTWGYEEIMHLKPAGLRKFTDFVGRDFVIFSIPI